MKTTISIKKELTLKILLLLSIIEGVCSIWATIFIPADSKKSLLFGLSASRLGIILVSIIAIIILIILLVKSSRIQNWCSTHFTSDKANRIITGMGILFILLLWITVCTPTKNLFPFEAIFIRLRPTLVWFELVILQFTLFQKIATNSFSALDVKSLSGNKIVGLVFILLVGIWIFITSTKIGLVQTTAFWNVPGIPLSSFQFISILLFIFLVLLFFSNNEDGTEKSLPKGLKILIPILIFGFAVFVWGSTPMLKHFFSLQPTPPNLQPYPYSDARAHDLGAISILKGDGVYFHGFTDKPMFMVFLALLHLIAGNDYVLLAWAQIFVLAMIPLLLYFFGKKFHSPLFGIVIAAIVILQQRNAIVLSYNIASVNPKLLVSEELMFLGIVIVTYLLFSWMKKPEPGTILLLGGVLGALSLVRMNPVFILPAIVLILVLYFRKKPGLLIKQTLLFGIGFLLVFSPWLFVGVDSEGKSWFFIKIQDVIINRYPFAKETLQTNDVPNFPKVVSQSGIQNISYVKNTGSIQVNPKSINQAELLSGASLEEADKSIVYIMANHFLHNFSTSLLALPDSIRVDNLSDLTQKDYWHEEIKWNGSFPPVQYILILANLALLSIGLVEGWKKFHWAGLAPLIIFLAYDFSLSVALNSGSRYIVPINWIIFFYYILGLFFIIKKVLSFLNIKSKSEFAKATDIREAEIINSKRSIIRVFVLLIFIAAIVPVANLVVPMLVKRNLLETTQIVTSIVPGQTGNQLIYGDILYPYYENNGTTITFDFLSNQVVNPILIESEFLIDQQYVFESDLPAVLDFSTIDGQQILESIYLIERNEPYLIWQKAH